MANNNKWLASNPKCVFCRGYGSSRVGFLHYRYAAWSCRLPNALGMLQAISTTATVPLARVNWNEPGQIMKILDAGCYGIICPMVSNREEAENFVQACIPI